MTGPVWLLLICLLLLLIVWQASGWLISFVQFTHIHLQMAIILVAGPVLCIGPTATEILHHAD
jgi:hypothetical protein